MNNKTDQNHQDHSPQQMDMFDNNSSYKPNPYWTSSLFSEVYLRNDVPKDYADIWDNDEYGGFYDFYQGFLDLVVEKQTEDFDQWNEVDTITNWIRPVMRLLGWEDPKRPNQNYVIDNQSFTISEEGRNKIYRPDLLYFDEPSHKKYLQKQKNSEEKLREARNKTTGPKIMLEAKYWNRLEDYRLGHSSKAKRDNGNKDETTRSLSPDDQCLKYMEIMQHDFGILSDGKIWRLYHKELSQGSVKRCFEFNLGYLMKDAQNIDKTHYFENFLDKAKYFYHFFSKASHMKTDMGMGMGMPFVYEILEYSKKYASTIEEDLRKRFVIAMGYACNAIKDSVVQSDQTVDLGFIRNIAESHLFNILFVKSCETRKILPIDSNNYLKISLTEIVDSLSYMRFDPEKELSVYSEPMRLAFKMRFKWDWNGFEIYNRLMKLYRVIHDGTSKKDDFGFEIAGFKESVFNKEEWRFARNHKIDNKSMLLVLFNLMFNDSEFKDQIKYQQIPYNYFTPRQLGSIYESLLEFKLEAANMDMVLKKGSWKEANLKSEKVKRLNLKAQHIVEKGQLFFTPNNKDRKMTGSYYTPDYIVQYIVENTLGPLIKTRTSQEILELKVCDPAMGSGHFLAGALDFLVNAYREKLSDELMDDIDENIAETSRKVLDACIFGVDINPRAVKLAKMSLWLQSAFSGRKLERLDDQLRVFDSLSDIQTWSQEYLKSSLSNVPFVSVIGNPPWGGSLESTQKEQLIARYEYIHQRTVDTYNYFLALAYEISSRSVGIIVPNNFLFQHDFSKARKFLLENFTLKKVVNLGDGIFSATVPSALLIIEKNQPKKTDRCAVLDLRSTKPHGKELALENGEWHQILQSECLSFTGHTIPFNPNSVKIITHIMDMFPVTLGDICDEVASGISTGGDKVFRISNEEANRLNIEKELLRPLIVGREFNEFSVPASTNFSIIYSTKYVTENRHPMVMQYLLPFKEKLSQRSEAKKTLITWWRLNRPRKPELFEKIKVVIRQTSSTLVAAVDENNFYCLNSILIIHPKGDISPYLVTAILNSSFMRWYYQQITQEQGRTFAEVKPINLRKLPFPDELIRLKESALIKRIISLSRDLHNSSLNKNIKDELKNKLNELVFQLYQIPEDQQISLKNSFKLAA